MRSLMSLLASWDSQAFPRISDPAATAGRGIKKCKDVVQGLDFWEVSSGPFRTMCGVPRTLKVGGLRPPTFLRTSLLCLGSTFSIFDLKKFEEMSVSGAQFLIPKFLIHPVGCISLLLTMRAHPKA